MTTRLSHPEFDIVWELLGLGERPYPFDVAVFGETMADRAALRAEVVRGLAERGLHDGHEPAPRFAEELTMLVRNQFSVDGVLATTGGQLRVLAAGRGERGLRAVQTDDEVRLDPVRGSVVASVVALLPDQQPGPGGPVSLPRTLFTEAARAYSTGGSLGFETALRGGGITGRDLRGLSTLVGTGRRGGGQFAVTSVDRLGRRARSAVLNWFDTEAGRYLLSTERRRDGAEWLTCAPGDRAHVARRLTELVSSV